MIILYGITLVPLAEDLRVSDPALLSPFQADDAAFDGSERRSASELCLLMNEGTDRGYFSEPAKSIFIAENLEGKEASRQEFKRAGLNINYLFGSPYLGAYLVPREEIEHLV